MVLYHIIMMLFRSSVLPILSYAIFITIFISFKVKGLNSNRKKDKYEKFHFTFSYDWLDFSESSS